MKRFIKVLTVLVTLLALIGSSFNFVTASEELEGELNLYTSIPDADAEQIIAGYNEVYPNVKVNVFRSGTEEVTSKIYAEHEAGDILADVIVIADSVTTEAFKEDDLSMEYVSPETENIPAEFVDSEGYYAGTTVMSTGIIYNTNLVEEAPTSWHVLTSEEANDNFAMPSPLYSGAAAYTLGVITKNDELGWPFYEALAANSPMVTEGNGAVRDAVAGGQKAYGIIVDYMAIGAKEQGSPVDFAYPEEGVPVITEPVAIMQNTDNKELAKTFVDFILSKEGQELRAEMGYAPIRTDVETPEGFANLEDLNVIEVDPKELFQTREDDKVQFDDLFN